ncbi:MAG TPA: DUF882 domain-containing protein [Nitrospirota bacterium]|nr:DUF882 domain-containing protein [Nitrospirota bacterium]
MISRRTFLQMLLLLTLSGYAGELPAYEATERVLNLYNTHTRERLHVTYCSCGVYHKDALEKINRLMRCHYTNEIKPIDVEVLDLLCNIKDRLEKDAEIQIISGYRSPVYNDYLWRHGRGAVKNSLHLEGRAIDFYLPRVHNTRLFKVAQSFNAGGVGYYPDFVHIDNGRVRYW